MRTSVWGRRVASSGDAPSSVLGFGNFAAAIRRVKMHRIEREGIHDAMLIALSTLCQLARTKAIASVPLERVASFCSKASIWDAMAALSWRSSLRFSSSAFFSFTRATSAGDWPVDAALADKEGCRMWPE